MAAPLPEILVPLWLEELVPLAQFLFLSLFFVAFSLSPMTAPFVRALVALFIWLIDLFWLPLLHLLNALGSMLLTGFHPLPVTSFSEALAIAIPKSHFLWAWLTQ